MKPSDFNVVKAHREIESIKSQVTELNSRFTQFVLCLEEREKTLLESIELNNKADIVTSDLIKKQEAAIAKLEDLNNEKASKLDGLGRWVILIVLGLLSLTVKYSVEYSPGEGAVIKPDDNAGLLLPSLYGLSIVAVATRQDARLGELIENVGRKLGS